jgi:hypothetical protein
LTLFQDGFKVNRRGAHGAGPISLRLYTNAGEV